jgi:uncharacterized protein (DUF433 family)
MNEIVRDPDTMGGTPVSVRNLFDYLLHGDSLDVFLGYFSTLSFEQAR